MDLKSVLNLSDANPNVRPASPRTINEEAGLGDEWQAVDRPPIIPSASAPQAGDDGSSRYIQGSLPPGYQHDTSFVGTSYRGSNTPRLDLMPLGIQGNPSTNAAIQSTSRLTAIPVAPAPAPVISGGDGLTHGRLPWSGDAGVSQVSDDFFGSVGGTYAGGSIANSGIGQLGWNLIGNPGISGGCFGGVPPYLGQFSWSNPSLSDNAAWMVLNSVGQYNSIFSEAYALADNAGWIMSFVFKLDSTSNSSLTYSITQKSMYVGLIGCADGSGWAGTPISRPSVFMGVRYDTSTGIGDAFLTLEVVANKTPNSAARNNTQGVTLVTSVAPVAGVWHRLDIFCDAAGSITLTLDGSGSNTLTTTIPTITFTTSINSTAVGGGVVQLDWVGDPVDPWSVGSNITASGFTGTSAFLNGTLVPIYAESASIKVNGPGTFANTDTVTFVGYPSLQPACVFGNDNQAAPTTNTAGFFIDFWSFVWNPNLGPNAPGTPDSTKPRYF